jgi:AcrR family transcriptional regulator
MRRDAARNRERLLSAARELLAAGGLDISLTDVARHAGLGVGTAYRHFSNKPELLDALLDERIVEITAIVDEALADVDPWEGLVRYLERSADCQLHDRALCQLLGGGWGTPALREQLLRKVDTMTQRARDAGVVRGDLCGADLICIHLALDAVIEHTRDSRPDLFRRHLALIVAGLRVDRLPAETSSRSSC